MDTGAEGSGSDEEADPSAESTLEFYHAGNLPPQEIVRAALSAFQDPASHVFFVMSEAGGEDLLQRIYGEDEGGINKADVCLLCALAAFGSHFASHIVPEFVKQSLFRTALQTVDECCEVDGMQSMRALLSITLFTLIEKRSSVRATLTFGLQIARLARLNGEVASLSTGRFEDFRKMFRSFIMLDSWLSTKLAHQSSVTIDEAEFVLVSAIDTELSDEDVFASELNALGRLAGTISPGLYDQTQYGLSLVNNYMQYLDAWHEALPYSMRLTVLTVPEHGDASNIMRTALLYLHETYLSMVVLLHRGLIPSILAQRIGGGEWSIDGSQEAAEEWYRRTMISAEQCVRANTLLAFAPSAVFRQCWLMLCEMYICTCLLLVDVAFGMFTGADGDTKEKLERIGEAISTMLHMQKSASMVNFFLSMVRPLYGELSALQSTRAEGSRSLRPEPRAKALLERAVQIVDGINQNRTKKSLFNAGHSNPEVPEVQG